jgi:hypothetical protein
VLPGLPVLSVAIHRLSSIPGEAQAGAAQPPIVRHRNAGSCTIPLEREKCATIQVERMDRVSLEDVPVRV